MFNLLFWLPVIDESNLYMFVSKRPHQQFIYLKHYHFIGYEYFIVRLKLDQSQSSEFLSYCVSQF